ncbi:MAG: Acetophenone carboxylase delta subunit [Alphaproteobacteria bacterium MarineAlpha11_Bin1]|nr:MAG: Acetophenone carboxylase delta subunit [Alphaproteobacteria bacterium MarineAlpha11_Bin1]
MTDPVIFEIIKHRLWQINDEQGIAIKTISASPIVVEGNDYNVGLFTSAAELVTAGVGSLVHVTTMGDALTSIIERAESIQDGDVFMTNDPFLGALHQNDVVVASPLFRGGNIFMWIGNVLHHPDVGGIDAGSFCINARTLDEDPPRFFMKIVDCGELVIKNEQEFVNNSRLPDAVALDLRAQIGAINVARTRLNELLDERGENLVADVMTHSINLAERQVRDFIRELPDGEWHGEAFMDGVRVGDERICRVALTLICNSDTLRFDYTGSSEQVDAAVNSTLPATVAGSAVPLYSFLCQGDIDWNDGLKRCIEVIAPEGSVVNATYPAPVSISTVGFRWLVTVAATQAVANMFNATDKFRDRACPSWNSSSNCNNIFADSPDGRRTGGLLSDHRGSGAAGRSFGDGFHHAGTVTSYASSLGNIEGAEWKFPIRYLYRRRMTDSAGAGRFRGGATSEVALTPHGVGSFDLKLTNTAGTEQTNAHGIDGGFPGAGSQSVIVRDANPTFLNGKPRSFPAITEMGGTICWLPSKADEVIRSGDIYGFWAAGGGGFGDPLDRDPEKVREDVCAAVVSQNEAERLYGVIFLDKYVIDEIATTARRDTIRQSRIEMAQEIELDNAANGVKSAEPRGLGRIRQPLSHSGPLIALRYDGDGPNFEIEETVCLGTGALVDVREVLKLIPGNKG